MGARGQIAILGVLAVLGLEACRPPQMCAVIPTQRDRWTPVVESAFRVATDCTTEVTYEVWSKDSDSAGIWGCGVIAAVDCDETTGCSVTCSVVADASTGQGWAEAELRRIAAEHETEAERLDALTQQTVQALQEQRYGPAIVLSKALFERRRDDEGEAFRSARLEDAASFFLDIAEFAADEHFAVFVYVDALAEAADVVRDGHAFVENVQFSIANVVHGPSPESCVQLGGLGAPKSTRPPAPTEAWVPPATSSRAG